METKVIVLLVLIAFSGVFSLPAPHVPGDGESAGLHRRVRQFGYPGGGYGGYGGYGGGGYGGGFLPQVSTAQATASSGTIGGGFPGYGGGGSFANSQASTFGTGR